MSLGDCPLCPSLKRRYIIEYSIGLARDSRVCRYDRIPFSPTRLVLELRREIQARYKWKGFVLMAREGNNGPEYSLHDQDVLKDALGPDEIIVVRERQEPRFEPVLVADGGPLLPSPPNTASTECTEDLVLHHNLEIESSEPTDTEHRHCGDAADLGDSHHFHSRSHSHSTTMEDSESVALPLKVMEICPVASLISDIPEFQQPSPTAEMTASSSTLVPIQTSISEIVTSVQSLASRTETVHPSNTPSAGDQSVVVQERPKTPTGPKSVESTPQGSPDASAQLFLVVPVAQWLAALHRVLLEESSKPQYKVVVVFPISSLALIAADILCTMADADPIFGFSSGTPASHRVSFATAPRGVLLQKGVSALPPSTALVIQIGGFAAQNARLRTMTTSAKVPLLTLVDQSQLELRTLPSNATPYPEIQRSQVEASEQAVIRAMGGISTDVRAKSILDFQNWATSKGGGDCSITRAQAGGILPIQPLKPTSIPSKAAESPLLNASSSTQVVAQARASSQPSSDKQAMRNSYMIIPLNRLLPTLHTILRIKAQQPSFKTIIFSHISTFLTNLLRNLGDTGAVYDSGEEFLLAESGIFFVPYQSESAERMLELDPLPNGLTLIIWIGQPSIGTHIEKLGERTHECRSRNIQSVMILSTFEETFVSEEPIAYLSLWKSGTFTQSQLSSSHKALTGYFSQLDDSVRAEARNHFSIWSPGDALGFTFDEMIAV